MSETETPIFTKSDFLGIRQLASKYKIDKDDAYAVLLKLYKNNVQISFPVKGVPMPAKRPAVTNSQWSRAHSKQRGTFSLHPFAQKEFCAKYNEMYPDKQPLTPIDVVKSRVDAFERATKRAAARKKQSEISTQTAIKAIHTKEPQK